ncbi:MAG: hypothetical protein ACXWKM_11020 [Phenylobacterium sp.]
MTPSQTDRLELDHVELQLRLAEDLQVAPEKGQGVKEHAEQLDGLGGILLPVEHLPHDRVLVVDTGLGMANAPPSGSRASFVVHDFSPAVRPPAVCKVPRHPSVAKSGETLSAGERAYR